MSSSHHSQDVAGGYDREEPPVVGIVAFLIVLFVFVVASGFGVKIYFANHSQAELHIKQGATPNVQWSAMKAQSDKQLSTYGWNTTEAGAAPSVHMPIQRAMELTIKELATPPAAPSK